MEAIPKAGLVLAGGGARAAYQVGVVQALREMLPDAKQNPFPIITGTSAGAINATALASHADNFGEGVDRLLEVWRHFEPRHVYRSDLVGVLANSTRWFMGMFFGNVVRNEPISLLDNRPLQALLERRVLFDRIQANVESGALDALAITCSGYTSGQSCSFFEAHDGLDDWKRSQRIGIKAKITVEHMMASSAIPFLFPAHKLNRDQPDIVFVDVELTGVMNALELCMYARGLDTWDQESGRLFLIGDVSERDAILFEEVNVEVIGENDQLPGEILDRVRAAMHTKPRKRWTRTTVSG